MSRAQRRTMVERVNPVLPVSEQCRLLAVSRSAVYRKPAEVSAEDLAIMALIDRQYLARPYYGSRRMAAWLATQGHVVNRKRVQRLMRLLGLTAIYQCPKTSKPAAAHKIYPYLLGAAANLPGRPVDMWTIGSADRLRFPRFPSQLGKRGNARLRPHTHGRHSQHRI